MTAAALQPAEIYVGLVRRLRMAQSQAERRFILVNETRSLLAFDTAALWQEGGGVTAISGVVDPEGDAPFVQWLDRVSRRLAKSGAIAAVVDATMVEEADEFEWREWLAPDAAFVSLPSPRGAMLLLLARSGAWAPAELAWLQEWFETFASLYTASPPGPLKGLRGFLFPNKGRSKRWKRPIVAVAALSMAGLLCLPVNQTAVIQAELVPLNPAVIRSPIEAIVDQVLVKPNEHVAKDQPLLQFDMSSLQTRLSVARKEVEIASTEFAQTSLQSLNDSRSRGEYRPQQARIQEKSAEARYLASVIARAQVRSPISGRVIIADVDDWQGRPVAQGERILVVADETSFELEAWAPANDFAPVRRGDPVRFFPASDPLRSVTGLVRDIAYQAEIRPDATLAYRIRATITSKDGLRIGERGTVRIAGPKAPAALVIFRKPLVWIRGALGL